MTRFLILLILLVIASSSRLSSLSSQAIENMDRNCDLTTQYVKCTSILRLKNFGDENINKFYFTIPKQHENKLFLLIFTSGGSTNELKYKIIEDIAIKSKHSLTSYEVTLSNYIPAGEKLSITVVENYYNRMEPYPKKILIADDQFVLFEDNMYFYSPYLVESQRTTYKLPSSPISFTENDLSKQKNGKIEYGTFINIQPFTIQLIKIHFENNSPFVVFKKVVTTIEVSHWGNIVIDGLYKLKNEGAILTGEYGRVDYSPYKPNVGKSALKSLKAELPYNSWGVYYVDEIGNISTSNAWRDHHDKEVKIEIKPRFAIFGGWKSNWHLGYNLPMHHYLFVNDAKKDEYTLKQFFGLVFEDLVAEDYELRVILPEGATEIQPLLPFDVDDQYSTLTNSYLDVLGRPTLVFKKKLVSRHHYKQFMIAYKFHQYDLLIEPLYLFAAFGLFFIVLIILGRAEFASLKMKNE